MDAAIANVPSADFAPNPTTDAFPDSDAFRDDDAFPENDAFPDGGNDSGSPFGNESVIANSDGPSDPSGVPFDPTFETKDPAPAAAVVNNDAVPATDDLADPFENAPVANSPSSGTRRSN